jgi:hapalindole H/12-epi-hapalindole U/12-epi-fischerindole U synthase
MANTTHIAVRALLSLGALATFTAFAPLASGAEIPVVNHSFEQPALAVCEFAGVVPGWTSADPFGTWNPGLGDECFYDGYPDGVADGVQTAFINVGGASIVQIVDATLEPNTKYTLSVAVGRRADCCQMVDYRTELVAGMTVIAEDPGLLDPAPGAFEVSTICFTTGAAHPAMGQPLAIRIYLIDGIQGNFDDVHLDASAPGGDCATSTPTPGDIDNSGAVDGADLGLLLGSWGDCADCNNCPADLNGDCTVDGADLGILLGNWG